MSVVVTGAAGFLGWHLRCALRAKGFDEVVCVDRPEWIDQEALDKALAKAEVVFHLAGVNRADPDEVRRENENLARVLTAGLDRVGARPHLVNANSIQCGNGTPFGDGKLAASGHLNEWAHANDAPLSDVLLPNLFGEHGRPHYNSVVATFCHELATGGAPRIDVDREIPLLHVQDAAAQLIELWQAGNGGVVEPQGRPTAVSAVLELLTEFRDRYATGDIPDITDPLHLALFNTYRSFTFPQNFPIHPPLRADNRGHLFEAVRAFGGEAQVFCSTTHPGITRGEHFHLRKVERFLVLAGTAEIRLRKLFTDEVITFRVSGETPAIVDMPTMWPHSITNVGDGELMTLFWAHEVLRPDDPDTYPEPVGECGKAQ